MKFEKVKKNYLDILVRHFYVHAKFHFNRTIPFSIGMYKHTYGPTEIFLSDFTFLGFKRIEIGFSANFKCFLCTIKELSLCCRGESNTTENKGLLFQTSSPSSGITALRFQFGNISCKCLRRLLHKVCL